MDKERLIQILPGIFLVGHSAPAALAIEYAALLYAGPAAAISHRPAAVLWRLLGPQADPTIHVTLPVKRHDRKGLKFHRAQLAPLETRTLHGDIRVTSPARTILDIAPTLDPDDLERVVADAIRRRLTTERQLRKMLDARRGARGTRALRAVLGLTGGPLWDRSRAERELIKLIRAAELPIPESNRRAGRTTPDLIWREHGVVAEIDGFGFHGDRFAFEDDRVRDADRLAAGERVLRFTWRRIRDHPLYVIARLAATLAQAGATPP